MTASRGIRAFWCAAIALASVGARSGEEPPPRVLFEYDGSLELGKGDLGAALRPLKEEMEARGVDPGSVEDAVYELELEYASQGYRHARIVAATERRGADEVVIRFTIDAGPRSIVRRVSFEGNDRFGPEELARCFQWSRTGRFRLGDDVYTEWALADGVACVEARYQQEGFPFVSAGTAVTEDDLGNVFLHVAVSEGVRVWIVRQPTFVFDAPSAQTAAELSQVLELETPVPYTSRLALLLRGKLIEHYRNLGFRFVEIGVDPQLDRGSTEASLVYRIKEGLRARIANVEIHGNRRTQDWVLRNRVKLRAGDLYSENRIRESYRSLLDSGLLSMVSIDSSLVEGSDDELNLDVHVKENARWRLSFLAGWGSYEYFRGKVELQDTNLFGTGHSLTFTGWGSFKSYGASARYLNPYVFNERIFHTAEAFYRRRENPSFTDVEVGGETGLGYRLTEKLQTGLAYRLKKSDAYGYSDSIPPELRQDVRLSSFLLISGYEFRDSIVNPLRGASHWLTLEYSGESLGSQLDFFRIKGSSVWIIPLLGHLRMVAAARVGAIVPLVSSQAIPVQERFFLGGESTIRSFKQDKAGPTIGGTPIGGEAYTCFNVELRFPLGILKSLDAAAFADTGSLVENVEDFGGGRYYFGTGGGIRYNTPFGPIRLDLAFNPDRRPGEELAVLHFGLGYPF